MRGGNFIKSIIVFLLNNKVCRFNLGNARFKSLMGAVECVQEINIFLLLPLGLAINYSMSCRSESHLKK